jgi:hypothetical protein
VDDLWRRAGRLRRRDAVDYASGEQRQGDTRRNGRARARRPPPAASPVGLTQRAGEDVAMAAGARGAEVQAVAVVNVGIVGIVGIVVPI